MKSQISLWILCFMASVFLAPHVAHAQCNNASLDNGWAYSLSGTVQPKGTVQVRTEAGLLTFDGAGHFTLKDTASINGTVTRWQVSQGTYYVNPNCTGALIVHRDSYVVHFSFTLSVNTLTLAGTDTDIQEWDPVNSVYVSTYSGTATKQ